MNDEVGTRTVHRLSFRVHRLSCPRLIAEVIGSGEPDQVDLEQIRSFFELVYYITVVLGVPVGVVQYIRTSAKERADREARIYDAVWASYIDYQRLSLQYPYLDVFEVPDEQPAPLTPSQAKEERVVLFILFSIFERAYLVYRDHPTPVTEAQWRGWDAHIRTYFRRANVRRAWSLGESTSDPRFSAYMRAVTPVREA